jgi:hypothetical protein
MPGEMRTGQRGRLREAGSIRTQLERTSTRPLILQEQAIDMAEEHKSSKASSNTRLHKPGFSTADSTKSVRLGWFTYAIKATPRLSTH